MTAVRNAKSRNPSAAPRTAESIQIWKVSSGGLKIRSTRLLLEHPNPYFVNAVGTRL